MRLLHSSSGWCRFTCSLGCQLFTWSFSSSRFTSGLLGTGHFRLRCVCVEIRNKTDETSESAQIFIQNSWREQRILRGNKNCTFNQFPSDAFSESNQFFFKMLIKL